MRKIIISLSAFALLTLPSDAFAQTAAAAEMPKEGQYDFTACWSGTSNVTKFSDKQSIFANDMTGVIRTTTPGGPFDGETFHCTGIMMMIDGKIASENTFCVATDKEGNKRLARFTNTGGTITREHLSGTGKYEGMTITPASVKPMGPFPSAKPGTFQGCNHQTGSYKLK